MMKHELATALAVALNLINHVRSSEEDGAFDLYNENALSALLSLLPPEVAADWRNNGTIMAKNLTA